MTSQLPLDARTILAQPSTRFTSRGEALAAGRQAVAGMLAQYPHALLLHMPCYYELAGEEPPWLRGLAGDFRAAAEPLGARMLSLQPQMRSLLVGKGIADRPDLAGLSQHQILALPQERWLELYRWFFLPEDLRLYGPRAAPLRRRGGGAAPRRGERGAVMRCNGRWRASPVLRRRRRLRRVRGGRLERHGLRRPIAGSWTHAVGRLRPMAFLVGVRLTERAARHPHLDAPNIS